MFPAAQNPPGASGPGGREVRRDDDPGPLHPDGHRHPHPGRSPVSVRRGGRTVLRHAAGETLELLVIDDASEDSCARFLESTEYQGKPIRYERNPERRGLIWSRARGAELARGDYITILDAHCGVSPGWLARLAEQLEGIDGKGIAIPLVHLLEEESWRVKVEEPLSTTYKGIEVYKLAQWQQGPVLLQALNVLEPVDLKSLGYNSPRYLHMLYQTMNLTFADRDFYYGDPAFPPEEPIRGLLSKEYARARAKSISADRNDPAVKPGDPYPFQNATNPFTDVLARWPPPARNAKPNEEWQVSDRETFREGFFAGTTSIEAADEEGWVVSVTPSGGCGSGMPGRPASWT